MGVAAKIFSVIIKSAAGKGIHSELTKDIIGISIDEISRKSIHKIHEFISKEKNKIQSVFSFESLKSMNVLEQNIDYVAAEMKDLFLKVEISQEVFAKCKYDSMELSVFLWKEYRGYKNKYIECESDIKKTLLMAAGELIQVMRESEGFEKDFLVQICNSVNDLNVSITELSDYLIANSGRLDARMQSMFEILQMILFMAQKDKELVNAEEEAFQNNKKQDYIAKWHSRLFLHTDNDSRPLTLADVFIMPDYTLLEYGFRIVDYKIEENLREVIHKFVNSKRSRVLLVQGAPGMGKSSIVAWIAHKYKDEEKIIILRFRDWENADLQSGLLNAVLASLKCKKTDLENKVLILDGFDEMKSVDRRETLLSHFLNDILDYKNINIMITSRPDYLDEKDFKTVINLVTFDIRKICKFYKAITEGEIDASKINDTSIIGIPVILYMAIMSKIEITEDTTRPKLYGRIFAENGGIFDRFSYVGEGYDIGSHPIRNRDNKELYLCFLREIAFKMYEINDLSLRRKDYKIPQLNFQGGYISVLEFPIKHLFETVELEIEFIHKSIYEYFVAEYIFKLFRENINESREQFAGVLGGLFKKNRLSKEIIDFLRYKVKSNSTVYSNYKALYEAFQIMLQKGMMYYTYKNHESLLDCEMNVFVNMLDILHLWDNISLELNDSLSKYINYNKRSGLNLRYISTQENQNVNLNTAYLVNANISNSDLRGVDLGGSDLRGVIFINTKLSNVNLSRVDLSNAELKNVTLVEVDFRNTNLAKTEFVDVDFRGTDLKKMDLTDINITGGIFDEEQILYLKEFKINLSGVYVKMKESDEVISYEKYCMKKRISNIYHLMKK